MEKLREIIFEMKTTWLAFGSFLSLVLLSGADASEKCDPSHLDIVFLVDSSSSINENVPPGANVNNWSLMKSFLADVVVRLPLEQELARAAVVSFSTTLNEAQLGLTDDSGRVIKFIETLPYYGGNTNTSGALKRGREILSSAVRPPPAKRVIVLVTDGFANVDSASTLKEARINKQGGIIQYGVGVTNYANEDELQDLVSDPHSYHYLNASDFSHLNLLIDELLQRLTCNQPPTLRPCKDTRADIVFILDSSGSIITRDKNNNTDETNWITMKKFFIDVANSLNVGPNDTRISLIIFSQEAHVSFHLNSYDDKRNITDAISTLALIGSQTNTSGALRTMNDVVFTREHGDRPDVHNVAILMTDGQSNLEENGTIPEARRAKSLGVRMFVVGLTDQINTDELRDMSSEPIDLHYFIRPSYSLVGTIVSNLVWNVCHGTCNDSDASCEPTKRCLASEQLKWIKFRGQLIIGHDYARLKDISSEETCKSICLQDSRCRSIEYLPNYKVCSVSYYRREDVVESFRSDSEVDYYEWVCSVNK